MLNPNMFTKLNQPTKKIEIDKISGLERTRWDEPIQVPPILYQKFKMQPPYINNQPSSNVNNAYPSSLIDFIGRAYYKCKDLQQRKAMEIELRQIIEKNKLNLNSIDWSNYRIPTLVENSDLYSTKQSGFHQYAPSFHQPTQIGLLQGGRDRVIQKQTISLPSIQQNQEMVSRFKSQSNQTQLKTKQILSKRLELLSQKYQSKPNDLQSKPESNASQKTFIGFKDQRQVRLEKHRQRYEQLSLKQMVSEVQNHPQQQAKKSQTIKPSPKQTLQRSLQVIQSRCPQKIYQVKPLPESLKKTQKKESAPEISKQQLQSIFRVSKEQFDLKTVAKRFTEFHKSKLSKNPQAQQQHQDEDDLDYKIVGKCNKIDKPYLRITHRPDPQTVRPETILRKAFNHYKSQYKKNTPYDLIISQFRSIRQDLTVQNIRNSFTVQVYEQNFRMSIFQDDTIQMKQCQTNLWQLYRQGLYNKRSDRTKFICYHFICMILQERYKQLQYLLTQIPPEVLEEKLVQNTLKLKKYLVIGNYHAFFTFYNSQDETCQKLMNHYIDKVRVKFLVMACKTFSQKISFKLLGINCAEDEDVLEALAKEEGAVVAEGSLLLKESYEKLKNSDFLQVKKVTSLLD